MSDTPTPQSDHQFNAIKTFCQEQQMFQEMYEFSKILERERDAERALADRLAEELRELCKTLMTDKPRDITNLLNKAECIVADWLVASVNRDCGQYSGQLIDSDCDCSDCEYPTPNRMEGGPQ